MWHRHQLPHSPPRRRRGGAALLHKGHPHQEHDGGGTEAQDAHHNAEEGPVDAHVDAGDAPVLVDDADASENVPVDADALNVLADAENGVVAAVYLPEPGCHCHCGSGDPSVPDVGVSRKC